jgi:hypothetical protein
MRCINLIRSRIDLESISHQIPAKLCLKCITNAIKRVEVLP